MLRLNKKLICLVIGSVICTSLIGCSNNEDISTSSSEVENYESTDDVKTKVKNNIVFASLKSTTNYFDGNFKMEDDKAISNINNNEIVVSDNSDIIKVNKKDVNLMANIERDKDDIYVPLDFLKDNVDANFNYNREENDLIIEKCMHLQYTSGFSVEYFKGGVKKVIDGENHTLILVPEDKDIPKEFKGENIVRTPVKNVLVTSDYQVGILKNIGEIKSIKEVIKEAATSNEIELKMGLQDGVIQYVSKDDAFDFNKIAFFSPKLVIVDRELKDYEDTVRKLEELNINYVVENSNLENNQNAKNEWGKLIGAFYDKEDKVKVVK